MRHPAAENVPPSGKPVRSEPAVGLGDSVRYAHGSIRRRLPTSICVGAMPDSRAYSV